MKLKKLLKLADKLDVGYYSKDFENNTIYIRVYRTSNEIDKFVEIKKNGRTVYTIQIRDLVDKEYRVHIQFDNYVLDSGILSKEIKDLYYARRDWQIHKDYIQTHGRSFYVKDGIVYKHMGRTVTEQINGPSIIYDLNEDKIYVLLRKFNAIQNSDNNYIKFEYNSELIDSLKRYNDIMAEISSIPNDKLDNPRLIELFNTFAIPRVRVDYESDVNELLLAVNKYKENIDKLDDYDVYNMLDDVISLMISIIEGSMKKEERDYILELKNSVATGDLTDPEVLYNIKDIIEKICDIEKMPVKKLIPDS